MPKPPSTPPKVAPFIVKLEAMLQQEAATGGWIVAWNGNGTAFEIHDLKAFGHLLLPKYFHLTKYASFQRQLHYFGFRKWTKTMTTTCTYSHPHFQRNIAERQLSLIRRKPRHRRPCVQLASPPADGRVPISRTVAPGPCPGFDEDRLICSEKRLDELLEYLAESHSDSDSGHGWSFEYCLEPIQDVHWKKIEWI